MRALCSQVFCHWSASCGKKVTTTIQMQHNNPSMQHNATQENIKYKSIRIKVHHHPSYTSPQETIFSTVLLLFCNSKIFGEQYTYEWIWWMSFGFIICLSLLRNRQSMAFSLSLLWTMKIWPMSFNFFLITSLLKLLFINTTLLIILFLPFEHFLQHDILTTAIQFLSILVKQLLEDRYNNDQSFSFLLFRSW